MRYGNDMNRSLPAVPLISQNIDEEIKAQAGPFKDPNKPVAPPALSAAPPTVQRNAVNNVNNGNIDTMNMNEVKLKVLPIVAPEEMDEHEEDEEEDEEEEDGMEYDEDHMIDASKSRKRGPTDGVKRKASTKKKGKTDKELPPPREHPFGDLSKFSPTPKNPATSFMQFSRVFRANKEPGKAPNAKSVSEAWNAMSEEQKKPYVDLALEDKQRVDKEIEEYIERHSDHLKNLADYKLLVSVIREKEKREKLGAGN